jgi:hypothetical protein
VYRSPHLLFYLKRGLFPQSATTGGPFNLIGPIGAVVPLKHQHSQLLIQYKVSAANAIKYNRLQRSITKAKSTINNTNKDKILIPHIVSPCELWLCLRRKTSSRKLRSITWSLYFFLTMGGAIKWYNYLQTA